MSSPAELLAQKHRETQSATPEPALSVSGAVSVAATATTTAPTSPGESDSEAIAVESARRRVNIHDKAAFPSLGKSVGAPKTALSWGSGALTVGGAASPSEADAPNGNGARNALPAFKPAVKSSTTQVTFIIDDDRQRELTAAERAKIIANVKSSLGVKIESTHSATTKKRTFLLSGKAAAVDTARKQLLRQITKPTQMVFSIPANLRSVVIGSRGKTLNPIIAATGVKIDIEKDSEQSPEPTDQSDEDLIFGRSVTVSLSGDLDSCEEAKKMIQAVVSEHSKSLNVKVPLEVSVAPFVAAEVDLLALENVEVTLSSPNSKNPCVILTGSREAILAARAQLLARIAFLKANLTTVEKQIPRPLHDLVDADKVFAQTNVRVEFPTEEASCGVKFIGSASAVPLAVDLARTMTAASVTDTLNLGKSHGSNLAHAKNITAYLVYTKFFDAVASETGVKIKAPSYAALANPETPEVLITFSALKECKDAIKQARKSIVELVNKIPPIYIREVCDVEAFLFSKIDKAVTVEQKVALVPLGSLANSGNKLLLVVQQSDDDEFLPSAEEINTRLGAVEDSLAPLKELTASLVTKTMQLVSADQDVLEKQLPLLLNKFEQNSLLVTLHHNAEGPSPDELLLRGYKSSVADALVQIENLVEEIKNYEEASKYNTITQIPAKHLARFIGQKGAHLNELSEEYNVNIDVQHDDRQAEFASVKLTGLKTNVDELIKKMDTLVKRWADEVSTTMSVEQKYIKKLVGPSGIYIKRLQDKYNVNIQLPREEGGQVSLRGPSRGVAKVEDEIRMLVDYERDNGHKDQIQVSKDALGSIIGRKGETLNDISADTGVNVDIGSADSPSVTVTLTGSKKGIAEAVSRIRAIEKRSVNSVVEEFEVDPKWYRNLIGPSGMTKRELVLKAGGDENDRDFRRLLQFPSISDDSNIIKCEGDKDVVAKIKARVLELVKEYENVVEERVEIPKNLHRFLIGPSGSVKMGIENEFNVKVFIPAKTSEKSDVGVKGAPENVSKVIEKLHSLVEGKK